MEIDDVRGQLQIGRPNIIGDLIEDDMNADLTESMSNDSKIITIDDANIETKNQYEQNLRNNFQQRNKVSESITEESETIGDGVGSDQEEGGA